MLVVKTFLAPSKIPNAGIGLFAGENIAKGQSVAITTSNTYDVFSDEEFETSDPHFQNFLSEFSCYKDGVWILEKDNEKFVNHSRTPNLTADGIASKDIQKGEEFTYDYREIDDLVNLNPPHWL